MLCKHYNALDSMYICAYLRLYLCKWKPSFNKSILVFKVFDKDNDGFITKDEFQKISKKLSKDQIEAVFAKFDKVTLLVYKTH